MIENDSIFVRYVSSCCQEQFFKTPQFFKKDPVYWTPNLLSQNLSFIQTKDPDTRKVIEVFVRWKSIPPNSNLSSLKRDEQTVSGNNMLSYQTDVEGTLSTPLTFLDVTLHKRLLVCNIEIVILIQKSLFTPFWPSKIMFVTKWIFFTKKVLFFY